jgi:hypothetical protein
MSVVVRQFRKFIGLAVVRELRSAVPRIHAHIISANLNFLLDYYTSQSSSCPCVYLIDKYWLVGWLVGLLAGGNFLKSLGLLALCVLGLMG